MGIISPACTFQGDFQVDNHARALRAVAQIDNTARFPDQGENIPDRQQDGLILNGTDTHFWSGEVCQDSGSSPDM